LVQTCSYRQALGTLEERKREDVWHCVAKPTPWQLRG
jgi:hypothetical protein